MDYSSKGESAHCFITVVMLVCNLIETEGQIIVIKAPQVSLYEHMLCIALMSAILKLLIL